MRGDVTAPVVTDAAVDAFWRDGVVCLRGVFTPDAIAAMAQPVDDALASAQSADLSALAGARRNRGAFGPVWITGGTSPGCAAFAAESVLPAVVAALLRSTAVYLYEDSVLVKEPGAMARTHWHQDLGYFHVDGTQLCTTWCPLDPADETTGAMRFVRGSHLRPETYRPNLFVTTEPIPGTDGEIVPDVDAGDFDARLLRARAGRHHGAPRAHAARGGWQPVARPAPARDLGALLRRRRARPRYAPVRRGSRNRGISPTAIRSVTTRTRRSGRDRHDREREGGVRLRRAVRPGVPVRLGHGVDLRRGGHVRGRAAR